MPLRGTIPKQFLILLSAVLLLAACDDGAGPPGEELAVERVVVSPDSVEIDAFGVAQFEAVVYGPNGVVLEGRAVEWASADTTLAVVSGSGVVTGRGVGRMSVTATVEGVAGSAAVVLTAPPIARVVASPESLVVAEGRSKALAVVAVDVQGREIARYPFEIGQASDPAVASVDAAGMVTGLAVGVTALSVRADTAATSVLIRVDPQWIEVHPSHSFSCALRVDGRAYCWGISHDHGHLGTGDMHAVSVDELAPVAGEQRFVQLTLGEHHACGIAADGLAYCWGWNGNGSLGTGDFTDRYVPTPVVNSGELKFQSITASEDYTCALAANAAAYCWGWNEYGMLGIGTNDERVNVPTAVAGGHTFKQVTTGAQTRTCGLTTGGQAYCWGTVASLTSATDMCEGIRCYVPVPVADGLVFEELLVSYYTYGCGRSGTGQVHCWRWDTGDMELVAAPVPFVALGRAGVFSQEGCALAQDGAPYCWALPATSGTPPALAAAPLAGGPQLKWITSGSSTYAGRVCGIGTDDLAYCWQDGAESSAPILIPRIADGQEP